MPSTSRTKWGRKNAAELDPHADLELLRRLQDRPIDTSDILPVKFKESGVSHRIPKQLVTLRLDQDVLTYFRSAGAGYQTCINEVLRASVHRAARPRKLRDRRRKIGQELEQLAQQAWLE